MDWIIIGGLLIIIVMQILLRPKQLNNNKEDLEKDVMEIAVQVNGKVKARIKVPAAIENADAIAAAKAEPAVAEAIAGKTIAKEIYVKGKLVNIAVKG